MSSRRAFLLSKGSFQAAVPQNEVQRQCADVVSPRLILEHLNKCEAEPQPATGVRMVANCAKMLVACSSVNDMSTQTCRSSASQENPVSTDDDQNCSARFADVHQKFKELRLTMMADVELKLQEHTAHLRTLLVEEVALQITSRNARPGAADADNRTVAVTSATLRAVGQVTEDSCGDLVKLRSLCSPSRILQEDADILELHWEAPDPRAETRRRLSAIEQQLRSREREAKVSGVMGNVDRLHTTATMATNRKHVRECEVLMKEQSFPWQQKQDLGSMFLDPEQADAKVCSEETPAPLLFPHHPASRPHEATEHSPYISTPGSRSTKRRQACSQRFASPELADILERRRSISEGQIAQQAYGAFISPRSKKKS